MFRIKTFLIFAFTLLAFCLNAQEKKQTVNYEKEGYVKASIIHYKVEGCGFLIELNDKEKTKLAPEKLADEFKKNKIKIWVKYALAKTQPNGTCMAGKLCEVIDIKKRK